MCAAVSYVKSCLVVCQLKSATLVQTVVAMFSDYIEILLVKVNNSKLAQMCFWLACECYSDSCLALSMRLSPSCFYLEEARLSPAATLYAKHDTGGCRRPAQPFTSFIGVERTSEVVEDGYVVPLFSKPAAFLRLISPIIWNNVPR